MPKEEKPVAPFLSLFARIKLRFQIDDNALLWQAIHVNLATFSTTTSDKTLFVKLRADVLKHVTLIHANDYPPFGQASFGGVPNDCRGLTLRLCIPPDLRHQRDCI